MGPVIRAVLFDMDGVLVDAKQSYFATICKTVDVYLESIFGFSGDPNVPCLDMKHIYTLKSAGGFNNEWDATRAFLRAIVAGLSWPDPPKEVSSDGWSAWLQANGLRLSKEEAVQKANLDTYVRKLKDAGGGPKAVEAVCKRQGSAWVLGAGQVTGENLVERIFQEIYLGPDHFKDTYQSPARFHTGVGYMEQEQAVIPPAHVRWVTGQMPCGIATGRPKREAQLALDLLGYNDSFGAVLTLDDARQEERLRGDGVRREKPHPYTLVEAMKRLGVSGDFIFFGDLTDDMLAAKEAARVMQVQCVPIAVISDGPTHAAAMRAAGAVDVIMDYHETARVLKKWIPSLLGEPERAF